MHTRKTRKCFKVRAFGLALLSMLLIWRQWTRGRGASWVPSSHRDARRMLEMAGVAPGEVVFDLGSGDGRVVIEAASRFGARAIGVELDLLRVLLSRLLIALHGLGGRARIVRSDLFAIDLSQADVVVCYLQQWSNDALEGKLVAELRPGTRVVSNRWAFRGLREIDRDATGKIRVYEV